MEETIEEIEEVQIPEYTFDLSSVVPQNHIWIDRGAKLTCENAGHLYHEAWKRKMK